MLCTSNVKDFPDGVMQKLGIQVVDPDTLIHSLAVTHPEEMARVLSMVLVRSHVRDGHTVHAYVRHK